jgi:hypothetical protein
MMATGSALVVASAPAGTTPTDQFWLIVLSAGCLTMHWVQHRIFGGCVHHTGGETRKNGDKSDV